MPFGITPACAGNTGATEKNREKSGDHPRMRGEYKKRLSDFYDKEGSPPHARGIPTRFVSTPPSYGITPACAGNTQMNMQ